MLPLLLFLFLKDKNISPPQTNTETQLSPLHISTLSLLRKGLLSDILWMFYSDVSIEL